MTQEEPIQLPGNFELHFTLTAEDYAYITQGLVKLPFENASPILLKLREQIDVQIKK